MKVKIGTGFIALAIAQNAFALSQCAGNVKDCGRNPFAAIVVGFSQVCSERQPENAKFYQAAVAAFFNGHSKEYARLSVDTEFQKELQEFIKVAATMSQTELNNECATMLSKGKGQTPPDTLKK